MITKKRYDMLKDSLRKGADLSPIDFENMNEYELAHNIIQLEEPIHEWFGLSYCSYLVLPRSILQSAPIELQKRIVKILDELYELFGEVPDNGHYEVHLKTDEGRFIHDIYRDYERGRRVIPY